VHPLLDLFHAAADGRFPPVDGEVTFLRPLPGDWEAVVSFTGHAVVASRLGEIDLADLGPDGFGAVLHPDVLLRMAGPGGRIGVIDLTMVGYGRGGGDLSPSAVLDDHPRVRYAREIRRGVSAFGDSEGLFTLGTGVAGRLEMSVETSGTGAVRGRDLIVQALGLVPEGAPVFAAVSPGNARSLRAFLACGFSPLGSEVLIRPATAGWQ
jgi:hypothetical protein